MNKSWIIEERLKPNLEIKQISVEDKMAVYMGNSISPSAFYGTNFPLINILGYTLNRDEIIRLDIDYTSIVPTCSIIFKTQDINFLTYYFPTDGEVVSIFLRSPSDKLKPIRNDFEIMNISYKTPLSTELEFNTISINARLKVPKFYDDDSFSFNLSSYETLLRICGNLQIGFASNIKETNDKMNWICFKNYEKYIYDITTRSWSDEDSFFYSFIDPYYTLNFIDVNKLFSLSSEDTPGLISTEYLTNTNSNEKVELEVDSLFLTNYTKYSPLNIWISSYKIINNSTLINSISGISQHVKFYDFSTKQLVDNELNTLITKNSENYHRILKGSIEIEYDELKSKKNWLGLQYSNPIGNVHKNYNYAYLHNKRNWEELDKMILQVELPQINHSLHIGQRIRIAIFSEVNKTNAQLLSNSDEKMYDSYGREIGYNKFLSGFFVIKGFKIIYDGKTKSHKQIINLVRREWNHQLFDGYL